MSDLLTTCLMVLILLRLITSAKQHRFHAVVHLYKILHPFIAK